MALHLNFNLLGQAFVVRPQNGKYFVTTEVIRHVGTFGKGLAQLGTGKNHAVFLGMRTGPQGSHAVTLEAVESPVDFQRLAEQRLAFAFRLRNLIKNILGIKQTIEVADTGMVAADDHPVDTVVLTEGCMQQAFTGSGIAHIKRVAALDDVVFDKVAVNQGVDALDPDLCRNITGFKGCMDLFFANASSC